jgi:hypothetical protein
MFDGEWAGGTRRRAVGRAAALFAGSLVALVGFVVASASLVAGFGVEESSALRLAALFGAVALLAAHLSLFGRTAAADRSRSLAGGGTALALAGVALFRTGLPAEWSGNFAEFPTVAAGAYVAGLLVLFGAGFTTDSDDGRAESDRVRGAADGVGGVRTAVLSGSDELDAESGASAVSDGGETEDELTFFDDEERS